MLVSWLQIQSTIHLIWWLTCSKLTPCSAWPFDPLRGIPQLCFSWCCGPWNLLLREMKGGQEKVFAVWSLTCFPLCAVVSEQQLQRNVVVEAKVHLWEGAHGYAAVAEDTRVCSGPVLKLGLLFAQGKMLVHALIFFAWSAVTSNGPAPDCTTSGES